MPLSSFCMSVRAVWPSIATSTFSALGAGKRKVTWPSDWTSGEITRAGDCAIAMAQMITRENPSRRAIFIVLRASLFQVQWAPQQVSGNEEKEYYRNYTVHGEKRGIELAQVVFGNQGVFVHEQEEHGDDTHQCQFSQTEAQHQRSQKEKHHQVRGACDPQGFSDAAKTGNGIQAGLAVEFQILAGVKNVETRHPEGDGRGQ